MTDKLKEYVFDVYCFSCGADLGWEGVEYYYTKDKNPIPMFSERSCMLLAAKIEQMPLDALEILTDYDLEKVLLEHGIYVKFEYGENHPILGESND